MEKVKGFKAAKHMAFKLISPKNAGKFVGSNRMSFFSGGKPPQYLTLTARRCGDATQGDPGNERWGNRRW